MFYADAFKLHDTHGVPLTLQIDIVKQKGLRISIPHFYRDAIKAGWKQSKALSVIREALGENDCTEDYINRAIDYLLGKNDMPPDELCFG